MARKLLRKPVLALVAVLAVALLAPAAAQAEMIVDGVFGGSLQTGIFSSGDSGTGGKWLVTTPTTSWSISGGAAVSTGGTDWLIQGVFPPTTACVNNGWKLRVKFDYLNGTGTGAAKVYGFAGDTGSWDPSGGNASNGDVLLQPVLNTTTGNQTETVQETIPLTQSFVAFAIGFNTEAVDNVSLELVAPVNLKLTPKALNLKSQGNWVTAFISIPEASSCYSLADIDKELITLTFGENVGFKWDWYNDHGKKLMMKFDRATLIGMLGGAGNSATLTISGVFEDGILFEGMTNIKVIPPKPKNPKGKGK